EKGIISIITMMRSFVLLLIGISAIHSLDAQSEIENRYYIPIEKCVGIMIGGPQGWALSIQPNGSSMLSYCGIINHMNSSPVGTFDFAEV
ncbi:MAG: hypothetical protein ABIP97_00605, partial [Chthoniobacterales bacterium]